jgi:hypothetical protein
MTSSSELQAIRQKMIEEGRATLGEPPTGEEMLAYTRGELSPDEEERVRELLVCYPELARTLTEAFPEPAEPGDPDYLPDEELARHWASLQKRAHRPVTPEPAGQVVPFRRPLWTALAAALALVFAASFFYEYAKVRQLTAERGRPVAVASQEPVQLYPDTSRGGATPPTILAPEGQPSVLLVPMNYGQEFPRYRLELLDSAKQPVWKTDLAHHPDQDAFTVTIPAAFLKRGRYRLVVSGLDGARVEEQASYGLSVPGRR